MSAKVRDLVHLLTGPVGSLTTKCGAVVSSKIFASRNPSFVTCAACRSEAAKSDKSLQGKAGRAA